MLVMVWAMVIFAKFWKNMVLWKFCQHRTGAGKIKNDTPTVFILISAKLYKGIALGFNSYKLP